MRFSISLLALDCGFEKLRFQDEAAANHDILTSVNAFEYRCSSTRGLASTDRPDDEMAGRSKHEYNVLAFNLLNRIRRNRQNRLTRALRNLRIRQHLRPQPVPRIVDGNAHLHHPG